MEQKKKVTIIEEAEDAEIKSPAALLRSPKRVATT